MMMPIRLAADARGAMLRAAVQEAHRRGAHHLGTDHLLLGLLSEPGGVAERALGVSLEEARQALVTSDAQALETIGVDPGLAATDPSPSDGRHLPLSSGARAAMVRAVTEAKDRGENVISTQILLTAVLAAEPPDPAAELVHLMQLDVPAIQLALRQAGNGLD